MVGKFLCQWQGSVALVGFHCNFGLREKASPEFKLRVQDSFLLQELEAFRTFSDTRRKNVEEMGAVE